MRSLRGTDTGWRMAAGTFSEAGTRAIALASLDAQVDLTATLRPRAIICAEG